MSSAAYIEGFCKTAEELGVDPVWLCKRAGLRVPRLVIDLARRVARLRPGRAVEKALNAGSQVDSARSWLSILGM